MRLSPGQLEKLSDLFMDLAKGLFLAIVAVPAITQNVTFIDLMRTMFAGIFFTYLSLKAVELKEVQLNQ